MQRETVTIIWFTGIITQFIPGPYNVLNLKINHNTLNKIINTYKADRYVAFINVRNDLEERQYSELIVKENIQSKLLFHFIKPDEDYIDILFKFKYTHNINYFIDCDRRRLVNIFKFGLMNGDRLIHVSQLLD